MMLTISNFKNSVEAMGSRLHVKLEEVELLLEREPDTSDFARRSTNKRQQHPQKRILAKCLYGDIFIDLGVDKHVPFHEKDDVKR